MCVASTALAKSAKTLSPAVLKIRPMVRSLGERRRGEATTLCDWAGKSVSQKRPHGWHLAKILEIAENSGCQALSLPFGGNPARMPSSPR